MAHSRLLLGANKCFVYLKEKKLKFTMWHFIDRWICKCSPRRATRMCQISVKTFKLIVKFSELGSSRTWTIFVTFPRTLDFQLNFGRQDIIYSPEAKSIYFKLVGQLDDLCYCYSRISVMFTNPDIFQETKHILIFKKSQFVFVCIYQILPSVSFSFFFLFLLLFFFFSFSFLFFPFAFLFLFFFFFLIFFFRFLAAQRAPCERRSAKHVARST